MSVSASPLPLIAFVDERLKPLASRTRTIISCCVFGRDRWMALHPQAATVGAVGGRRRLPAIDAFLESVGGIAVLVYADVPSQLLPPGEKDGTDDIPRMSRTDNVWSQVILSGVAAAVARIARSGTLVDAISLYYDRKDLTAAHRAKFEDVLRQTLPKIAMAAADAYPDLFVANPSGLVFDTIKSVDKPADGASPDAFQRGTSLAHHVCSQADMIIARGSAGRVVVADHSVVIRDMISKFTA